MDKKIILEAIKNNGFNLSCASEEIWNDKEIVIEAVKNNPFALDFASKEIRMIKKILLCQLYKI